MVQFGCLSAYGSLDLYIYFQKSNANGHPKADSIANITICA